MSKMINLTLTVSFLFTFFSPKALAKEMNCASTSTDPSCSLNVKCQEGEVLTMLKVGCNLEKDDPNEILLNSIEEDKLSIVRQSNNVKHGVCMVDNIERSTGQVSLDPVLGRTSVSVRCQEKEIEIGECAINLEYECKKHDIFYRNQNIKPYFTTPKYDSSKRKIVEDLTIEKKIIDFINDSASDASIYISIYQLSNTNIANAIENAIKKKKRVKIVSDLNNKERPTFSDSGIREVCKSYQDTCRIRFCTDLYNDDIQSSCIGKAMSEGYPGINHNKFILVTKNNDGDENLILQTSHNFTYAGTKKFQDMVIIKNNLQLFHKYLSYFYEQFLMNKNYKYSSDSGDKELIKGYFFPKAIGQSDTVLNILNNVKCEGPDSSIKIAMGHIRTSRKDVLNKLAELSKGSNACSVKVITSDAEDIDGVRNILGDNILIYKDSKKLKVHSKLMLIDAKYGDDDEKKLYVFTGSHNLSKSALYTNDEILLKIKATKYIFNKYKAFWEQLENQ